MHDQDRVQAASIFALIESAGARTVFLPPYSHDLTPIEMMMSGKVKLTLRRMEARNNESLFEANDRGLAEVTAHGAVGWFADCGYGFV